MVLGAVAAHQFGVAPVVVVGKQQRLAQQFALQLLPGRLPEAVAQLRQAVALRERDREQVAHVARRQPALDAFADHEFVSTTYRGGPKLVQIFADGDDFLRDVGVEDLAFVSNYRDTYSHFFNRASDGYNFLGLDDVRESWVRRVRMRGGTRGITFGRNGKNNVVYDVLFEGNNGHYSITTAGNTYGNHASFLRESSPAHHGFGATSSVLNPK